MRKTGAHFEKLASEIATMDVGEIVRYEVGEAKKVESIVGMLDAEEE